ncbi:PucC family protein, partial [Acinetobacter baumannii]
YSASRLLAITAGVAALSLLLTLLAVAGIDRGLADLAPASAARGPAPRFGTALAEVWAEPKARRFTIFVFVSMLAYSAQDLILEPFAGAVFAFTPGA